MSSICMWRFQNSTPSLNRKHKRWLRRKTNHKICFAEDCYRFFFLLSFFQPTAHLRYFGQDSYKSNWTGLFYNSMSFRVPTTPYKKPPAWPCTTSLSKSILTFIVDGAKSTKSQILYIFNGKEETLRNFAAKNKVYAVSTIDVDPAVPVQERQPLSLHTPFITFNKRHQSNWGGASWPEISRTHRDSAPLLGKGLRGRGEHGLRVGWLVGPECVAKSERSTDCFLA